MVVPSLPIVLCQLICISTAGKGKYESRSSALEYLYLYTNDHCLRFHIIEIDKERSSIVLTH